MPACDLSAFAVPTRHRPDAAGCAGRSGADCSGGSPRFGAVVADEAPSVPDLGWSTRCASRRMRRPAMRATTTSSPPADPVPQLADDHEVFDVNAVRADFPILQGDRQRKAADLVRQRGDHAEAAGGHRPAVVVLRARELQHPPRRARVGGPGHRCLRRGPRHRSPTSSARQGRTNIVFVRGTTEAINLVAYAWGGKHLQPGRRDRHHPPGAPRQYRSVATAFAADRRDPEGGADRRRGQPAARRSSRSCWVRRPNWLRPPRSPTRWAR